MNILLWGQYPRSERLVEVTRDFDRKRVSEQELAAARKEDSGSFARLQDAMPFVSTGLFGWQDLLRPFADIVPTLKVTGLKRFFETNTFWKVLEPSSPEPQRGTSIISKESNEVTQPSPVTHQFSSPSLPVDESDIDDWIKKYFFADGMYPVDAPLVFTLPFIYLFKEYTRNVDYEAIVEMLDVVAKKLMSMDNKLLVFAEPSFGWREISKGEKDKGLEFIKRVKSYSGNRVVINTYFFDVEKEKDFLYSLPVDGIGIDFYSNSIERAAGGFPKDKMLIAGVLSTDSTHIEEREKLTAFFSSLEKHVDRSRIWGTSAGPIELLPRVVADEKVRNLKEVLK